MSNRHKLYDLEVTPPQGSWDRIAEALDQFREDKPLADKLLQATVTPPASLWNKISEQLDDESFYQTVAQKLQDAAVEPPASSWTMLEKQLQEEHEPGKIIPMPGKRFGWKKLAVAASIAGLLGYTTYFMMERANKDNDSIAIGIQIQEQHKVTADSSKNMLAMNNPAPSKPEKTAPENITNAVDAGTHIKTKMGNAYKTSVENNADLQGRYIVLMTENGEVVRMSKKLGGMADCIAGADNSTDCSKQIKNWQKELASLPVTSSPGNILDILSLANEENQSEVNL